MRPATNERLDGMGSGSRDASAASLLGWIRKIACSWFARIHRARGERRLELLETLQLGGKRQMMLIVCEGQKYLVGAGGDSVHSIAAILHSSGESAPSYAGHLRMHGSQPEAPPSWALDVRRPD